MKKHFITYCLLFFALYLSGIHTDTKPEISIRKTITEQKQTVNITISNGAPPYSVKCYGPGFKKKKFQKASFSLKNLKEGKYLIVVKDAQNNLNKQTFRITGDK